MDEHVGTARIRRNETKSLIRVEKPHVARRHIAPLPFTRFVPSCSERRPDRFTCPAAPATGRCR